MVTFPNCKINLGLNIINKRDDGFHNLETVLIPVPVSDVLEIISSGKTGLTVSGLEIDIEPEENICLKAYHLLKKDFQGLPGVQIHLHKAIPSGAGLGGGSSDASFALKLLNKKYQLNLSAEQLINYAKQLGSDCPFFIINKPCLATGRGEILEEININLSAFKILIINPGIHINTGWAFTQITPALPVKSIREIIKQPVTSWKEELKNDFEDAVFRHHPEIKSVKELLYANGAIYAALSGSGSAVFGLFEKEKKVQINFPETYFVRELFI